jgi:hypothetical protein
MCAIAKRITLPSRAGFAEGRLWLVVVERAMASPRSADPLVVNFTVALGMAANSEN